MQIEGLGTSFRTLTHSRGWQAKPQQCNRSVAAAWIVLRRLIHSQNSAAVV